MRSRMNSITSCMRDVTGETPMLAAVARRADCAARVDVIEYMQRREHRHRPTSTETVHDRAQPAAAARSKHGRRARRRSAAPAPPAALGRAFAQADDLAPYRAAKINWKQAEGETITVAVIPASYFENLISLQPQFEALTGIKLRFEKVPPGQIRQKAMLDLSSKTATYATHAADPMYYPLYVANKWVEPLDKYLNDADAHRRGLVQLRRHHQGLARRRLDRRQALRHPVRRRGDGAGLPQGPVRRQGPEARRHLRPAASPTPRRCTDPDDAHLRPGAARLRRRRPEHVHLPVALPRLRRQLDAGRQASSSTRPRRCRRSSGTSTR